MLQCQGFGNGIGTVAIIPYSWKFSSEKIFAPCFYRRIFYPVKFFLVFSDNVVPSMDCASCCVIHSAFLPFCLYMQVPLPSVCAGVFPVNPHHPLRTSLNLSIMLTLVLELIYFFHFLSLYIAIIIYISFVRFLRIFPFDVLAT